MTFSQDLTGQQFGSYRLIRRLGVGGFASVYMGQHVRLPNKQAAIKILDLCDVDEQQFQQEAETTERLIHPNIVRLLDFDVEQGTPFLVLDYAPGGSVRTRHPKGSQVPLTTVIGYLNEIAPALQYAHDQHILHHDIKPDNILIGRQGELLLSDFGTALLSRTGRTSQQGPSNTGGMAAYMAPEQFRGKPERASDQYALATVIYEWLCGNVPFTEVDRMELGNQHNYESVPPLRASISTLPATAEAVVMKALAKRPQDRFPSVQAFAQALEATSQHLTPMEVHQSVQDEPTEFAQTEESFSPLPTPSVPSPLTKADQLPPMEIPTITQSSPNSTVLAEVPTSPALSPLAPISLPVRHKRVPNRLRVFILVLVLLIALSGGGLYSLGLRARIPTLSPAQATATAAAKAYAEGTAKQGVMFGFDAAHTHYNPYEHTLSPANISQLKPLWNFPTRDVIHSSPTVAGGMVYVGSDDHKLYTFDAACRNACKPLWSFATGDSIESSPAVAGGMVYVGSDDGKLYTFDASCRKACLPLWSFSTGNLIPSSPTVADSMVYVGSFDGELYAFDASCRKACLPLWSFSFPLGDFIDSSPAVAGGMVYVGSDDGKLYAFDASCRKACLPLWSFSYIGFFHPSLAIADGMVYVGTSSDHKLSAFDATCRKDCLPLWSFATGDHIDSSPAIAGGMVYIGSSDHNLYAFDASCRNNCLPLWSFSTGSNIATSPAIAGGMVYIGSNDHNLYAFDASCRNNCLPLWSFGIGDWISSSPAVANGMIYVGSEDHKLYAFGLVA